MSGGLNFCVITFNIRAVASSEKLGGGGGGDIVFKTLEGSGNMLPKLNFEI